ncbi:MAG: tRNA pseudouridine(55) synthase TruB [Pseudomonadota bacterium]
MARRKRGRDIDGWLVVDKPLGPTSAQIVARVRRALDAKKAGHAGTLDPLATGVLAVAFGEATKTVPAAQDGAKTYRFTVRLGQATATDDAEGAVIAESEARPDDAAIRTALETFRGETLQVPPIYSAVKHDGARAYDLARRAARGEPIDLPELAARPLIVHDIRLIDRPDPDHAEVSLCCGAGGYVRAVARDLGRMLGCQAHVTALRRTAAGPFTLAAALPGVALEAPDGAAIEAALQPVAAGLSGLMSVEVTVAEAEELRHGRSVIRPGLDQRTAWAALCDAPVALIAVAGDVMRPTRVFAPTVSSSA